jgi:hypothetical protein
MNIIVAYDNFDALSEKPGRAWVMIALTETLIRASSADMSTNCHCFVMQSLMQSLNGELSAPLLVLGV